MAPWWRAPLAEAGTWVTGFVPGSAAGGKVICHRTRNFNQSFDFRLPLRSRASPEPPALSGQRADAARKHAKAVCLARCCPDCPTAAAQETPSARHRPRGRRHRCLHLYLAAWRQVLACTSAHADWSRMGGDAASAVHARWLLPGASLEHSLASLLLPGVHGRWRGTIARQCLRLYYRGMSEPIGRGRQCTDTADGAASRERTRPAAAARSGALTNRTPPCVNAPSPAVARRRPWFERAAQTWRRSAYPESAGRRRPPRPKRSGRLTELRRGDGAGRWRQPDGATPRPA